MWSHPGTIPVLAVAATLLAGCGLTSVLAPVRGERTTAERPAPVVSTVSPGVYQVRKGDTLYSIAFRYGVDFRDLAAWNGIGPPYLIRPGQRIVTRASTRAATLPSRSAQPAASQSAAAPPRASEGAATPAKSQPKAVAPSAVSAASASVPSGSSTRESGEIRWAWPVRGDVLTTFSRSGNKGIDIAGASGAAVKAAADGRVVYSGGGLIGYGELIIVKHNKHYLSAYGHNEKLLVKQGDTVRLGQHIATMGDSGTDRVKLHFEIRRDGKPVDPTRYLPK